MNPLELIVQDGGTQDRRQLHGLLAPPLQQFEHQSRDSGRRRWHVLAHAHGDHPVAPRVALVHHRIRQQAMQGKDVLVPDDFLLLLLLHVLFHVAQSGEVVQHLALRAGIHCGQLAAFVQCAHLFEGQRIALDGGGGVAVARARVLLQRRNPRQLHRRTLNPLP